MAYLTRLVLLAVILVQAITQTDSQSSSIAPGNGGVGSTIPTTTISMQPLPMGYMYTWTLILNAQDPTANTLDPHTTENGCKWACLSYPTCIGLDFIPGLPSQPGLCYLSYNSSLSSYPGCFHWELQRNPPANLPGVGPACQYTYNWTLTSGVHVYGGTSYPGVNDYLSCENACVQNINCTGVDFNPTASSSANCYLIFITNPTLNTINGVNHYDITRICTMIPPSTTTSGECTPTYTMFANSSALNGVQQLPGTTEQMCRAACTNNPSCYSMDMNTMTSLCYLVMMSGTDNPSTYGTSIGVNHYVISRNTNCGGCTNLWTLTPDTTISNTTSGNATTEIACQMQCLQNTMCTAITFYQGTCSMSMSMVSPNSTQTLVGSDCWTLTRDPNCGACTDQWNKMVNMSIGSGSAISWAVTNADCRMACIMDSTCLIYTFFMMGYGSNPVNYCLTTSNTVNPMQFAGAISYARMPSPCSGDCTNAWTLTANMYATSSRYLYSSSMQEVSCKNTCIQNPSCTGVDLINGQCWFVMVAPPQLGQQYSANHWDLKRGEDCGECSTTWSSSANDSQAYGAPTTATTESQCRMLCIASPTCTSYLYSMSGRLVGSQTVYCWVNLTGAAVVDPTITRTDLIRSPCGTSGVCPIQWMLTGNSSSTAASSSSSTILAKQSGPESSCMSSCAANINCVAIDYYNNATGSTLLYPCYMLTTANYPLVPYSGADHWDLVREFPASCNSGCIINWTLMPNTHLNSGTASAPTTEVDCKTMCAATIGCTSIDFNPGAAPGYQCWLGNGQPLQPGPGINHYVLNNNCNTTVASTVTTTAAPNASSASTLQSLCVTVGIAVCLALHTLVAMVTHA